jgi:hypothetical protein
LAILLFCAPNSYSQAPSKPAQNAAATKIAAIKSFRIVQEKTGQAVEILSTRPVVPAIQLITDPDRLVIDLPNARLETAEKKIIIKADQIKAIRADQFQQNPPVTRVVVDLLAPRAYTWDAAGNRLVVHLGMSPNAANSPFQAPTAASLTRVPQPVVTAVRGSGPLSINGNEADTGSSFSAGADTTILRLSSGGEVHVCPGTTLAVTPSQNRHNLMLSMNAGALEAHFALDASSDSVMTPDFRIMLVGPGEFHYAISADHQGNTCVRALPGNTASAIVSELLGDRTYQVKATDQLVFRSGQLDRVDNAVPLECGCPPARETPLRAANDPVREVNREPSSSAASAPSGNASVNSAPSAETAAAPNRDDTPSAANELHVQVEAPFVFHATGPPPAPVEDVSALPLEARKGATPALSSPEPPATDNTPKPAATETTSTKPAPSRGFFGKIGSFFAALFR